MTLAEDLLDLQSPVGVRLSPNAQQVVYSTSPLLEYDAAGEHALSTIWIASTGIERSARQLTSGLHNDQAPMWSPNGKSIAFISDRAKQSESSAIYVLPIEESGEAYPVTPTENERSIDLAEWSPDGESIAYISADEKTAERKNKEKERDDPNVWGEDWPFIRLRIVHVATKEISTLVTQNANIEDFTWNDDGTKIAFITSPKPHIESTALHGVIISIVDTASKDVRQICTFPKDTSDLIWVGESLYFLAPVGPISTISPRAVYTIDLSASEPAPQKLAHGEVDDADDLRKTGQDVIIHVLKDVESQIGMLQGRTFFSKKKNIESWDSAFTTDSDEIVLALSQGDTNSPPEVFTTTASGGAMVQLSNHGEVFGGRKFGTTSFFSCDSKSVKGEAPVRLDGVFAAPITSTITDGKPDKPVPTVVIIHGGPYSRNTDQFHPDPMLAKSVLLSEGYGVLLVNYRGSSGRGVEFTTYTLGGMGVYDHADVIELVNAAIEQGYADKESIIVSGWSQGGHLSYLSAVRNGEHGYGWKFNAVIAGAGVTDWDAMTMTSDLGATSQARMAGEAPWKLDKSDISGRSGSALWEFAGAAKKNIIPPVMILHGEQDERVPIEQGRAFRRALEDAKLPFECITYPREGHDLRERKHVIDLLKRVVKFVDLHTQRK